MLPVGVIRQRIVRREVKRVSQNMTTLMPIVGLVLSQNRPLGVETKILGTKIWKIDPRTPQNFVRKGEIHPPRTLQIQMEMGTMEKTGGVVVTVTKMIPQNTIVLGPVFRKVNPPLLRKEDPEKNGFFLTNSTALRRGVHLKRDLGYAQNSMTGMKRKKPLS